VRRQAFIVMAQPTPTVSIWELAGHASVGAGLGILLALILIAANPGLFNLITSSPSPKLTLLVVIGAPASTIAVGSTLTGFIFSAIERS
jgi:hypothetical protein